MASVNTKRVREYAKTTNIGFCKSCGRFFSVTRSHECVVPHPWDLTFVMLYAVNDNCADNLLENLLSGILLDNALSVNTNPRG